MSQAVNEVRNSGKFDGKTSGMNDFEDRKFKTHFRGHEGLSFYIAVKPLEDLLERGVITIAEMQEILTIISLHGTLFDNIKDAKEFKPEKVANKWSGAPYIFENFVRQVKYDSTGRFFMSADGRKNDASQLGINIFGPSFVNPIKEEFHKTRVLNTKKITTLVGAPNVGKTTWLEKHKGDAVVISRDDTLMEYGKKLIGEFYDCPECDGTGEIECTSWMKDCERCDGSGRLEIKDYSSIWKNLKDSDQKEIDTMVQTKFKDAVKAGKDIIIDMTCTSKKSRRKWFSNVPNDYRKDAIVFVTDYDKVFERNKNRAKETGKFIPPGVIKNMMKGFMVPMYDEVDVLHWAFS